ncbi:helix-turn-helix transcriptional regulator [Microlunatus sp. Gsoil 973]|uniref:helix-turn-helix transcriptional regulator n=1 Tax=Microlunatus sp. Gsoil 973 TaxID=2672569 RepID=UPI0012B50102|nr:helix-turn-helix transcriptional regulator [Microlunatus sp. Gsoil 973]QGN34138.1 helix-turn-helix domain-containing protein [Microlunatus sp. Gsoil 973]
MDAWEFGLALRRWRDRIAPGTVGVPNGSRRRARGLRREELAGLAGISVDYLTRLEQGRATSPSAQVVEALARALRLSHDERDLLFRLAGLAAPGPGTVPTRIAPSVQRLLDRLSNTPVAVFDAAWNLLITNAPYEAVLGETTNWRGLERNAVWRNLTGAPSRVVHLPVETAEFHAGIVAELRATSARYPADPGLQRLIDQLRTHHPGFVGLWERAEPAPSAHRARHKTIDHPEVGLINLDCDTLVVAHDDLRIMVYTAEPDSEDAEKLALAVVVGTQSLVD